MFSRNIFYCAKRFISSICASFASTDMANKNTCVGFKFLSFLTQISSCFKEKFFKNFSGQIAN
jgi:hypothetical protein